MLSEHIWPVTVKAKGLSGNRDKGIPPGSYRLCLTNTDVSLIRLYSDKPDVVVPVSVSASALLNVRLGFKTCLSKTKTKTLMSKTKTETQDLQNQYWKFLTGINCDKQKD